MDLDLTSICKTGEAGPFVDDSGSSLPLEIHVNVFKLLEELRQNLDARLNSAGRYAQRRCAVCDVFGKMLMIRVHANSHNHRLHKIDFSLDFGKDSTKFLSADE